MPIAGIELVSIFLSCKRATHAVRRCPKGQHWDKGLLGMAPYSAIASAGAAGAAGGVADVVAIVIAAGAGAVVAVDVDVAVAVAVAVALPTLHRVIHRTCHQSGEDTDYTRGKRDNQGAVQHRWVTRRG